MPSRRRDGSSFLLLSRADSRITRLWKIRKPMSHTSCWAATMAQDACAVKCAWSPLASCEDLVLSSLREAERRVLSMLPASLRAGAEIRLLLGCPTTVDQP